MAEDKKPKKWMKAEGKSEHKEEPEANTGKMEKSGHAYSREDERAEGTVSKSLKAMHKASKKHHVSPSKMMHSMYGKEKE